MEDDIIETVDEFVDTLNPSAVEREAVRLGLSVDELLTRIVNETKARLS